MNKTGEKFGRLTVISKTKKRVNSQIVWRCLCDCGNIAYVSTGNLQSNHRSYSC